MSSHHSGEQCNDPKHFAVPIKIQARQFCPTGYNNTSPTPYCNDIMSSPSPGPP